MRTPLLSFFLVLAVVATVPVVSKVEEAGNAAGENGGSIKPLSMSLDYGDSITPLSWSLDGYGPQEKAAQKPKEQNLDVQGTPKMTPDTYDQKPIEKQSEKAVASTADDQPDKYVASLVPDEKEKEEAAAEVKKAKKVKKEKKEKEDYLDESTSSKKAKKEKSDDSEADVSTSSKKKKKKAKTDDSDEDASLTKKEKKKHKKDKSESDDLDSSSPKKQKKEKSIDSDASSAYLKQEEKKSGDSDDEATSHKKQKKDKKKKKKKSSEENPEEDAAPVDVSPGGKYVSSEKSNSDATPVDVKGGERQISIPADAYASPNQDASSQPMAAGSPDELLPAAKSSASPQQQQFVVSSSSSQPVAGGSPDELPPAAKTKATFDPYLSSKQQVVSSQQPMASGSPDELPPQAKIYDEPAAGKPKMSMETFSGMLKKPITSLLSPVIKSVCAKTEFPADCEESIAGIPGAATAAATDSVGVLRLAMEAVREKVVVALNAAMDRMHAPGVDGVTKDALNACTASYSDLKSSLDTVDDALKKGDVNTVQTNLDAVETDLTTCDDGFQEHGTPSVMTDHDEELQKLAHNLLSIGSTINHQ